MRENDVGIKHIFNYKNKPLNSLELRGLFVVGPPGLEPVPKSFGMIYESGLKL